MAVADPGDLGPPSRTSKNALVLVLVDYLSPFSHTVGGTAVPPGELSPRTCGTRVRCPPGPLALGGGVPPLGQMSPRGPLALGSDVPLSGLLTLGSDAPWPCY